jgi:hypothetical protein
MSGQSGADTPHSGRFAFRAGGMLINNLNV